MVELKKKLLCFAYLLLVLLCIVGFGPFAKESVTYTSVSQNPDATMEKYKDIWADRTIRELPARSRSYKSGEVVGHITIPKMEYYEMPIYYGSDKINNNWQITTPGYLGNWDMFGECGVASVGAHNYQLFQNLGVMETGDLFLIDTKDDIFIYEVTRTDIYDHTKDDWTKLTYTQAEKYSVSLMTCYPIEKGAEATLDTYIVYSTMVRGTKYTE